MKYDLYEVLEQAGYAKQENITFDILEKVYQGISSTFKVMAIFNHEHSVVTVHYFHGGSKRAFKVKTHLNEKRAYNAIKDTLRYSGNIHEAV